MGRSFSKSHYSFSQHVKNVLSSDPYYKSLNSRDRRTFRQLFVRGVENFNAKESRTLEFVPPVLDFVPRSVLLRSKSKGDKGKGKAVDYPGMASTPIPPQRTLVKRNRLNKRRRAARRNARMVNEKLSNWRNSPEGQLSVPNSQMIRRAKLLNAGMIISFVSNVALSVSNVIETLKALVFWGFYAWNSDDFALLARLTSYFTEVRRNDIETLNEIFKKLQNSTYLIVVMLYVRLKEARGPDEGLIPFDAYIEYLFAFLDREGLRNSLENDYITTARELFLGDYIIINLIITRERQHFLSLLYRASSRELTRLRGIRLFRGLVDTVLSLPLPYVITEASRLPSALLTPVASLRRLCDPPGSEVVLDTQSDDYILTMANWARLIDVRQLVDNAESSLRRRGRGAVVESDEPPRFEEVDEDVEGGAGPSDTTS